MTLTPSSPDLANPLRLDGKIALVTGAASGIGRGTAQQLQALGAQLVVSDRNAQALGQQTWAQPVLSLPHDVTEEADWVRVMGEIEARHGRLDILVNNAGVMMSQPFAEAPLAVLRRQLSINVESVYLGMQQALPLLRRARAAGATSAAIINISSIYGKVAGAQFAAYSASKGAVRALSKAVAFELATEGIRVNTVLPGPVQTNLGADWEPPRHADGTLVTPEEALRTWAALIPMGRLGRVEDIAPLVAYLASDAAGFVTGAEFIADGGYTAA